MQICHFRIFFKHSTNFLGGNQRDIARAKAQKKLADVNKGKREDGLTPEQRKLR